MDPSPADSAPELRSESRTEFRTASRIEPKPEPRPEPRRRFIASALAGAGLGSAAPIVSAASAASTGAIEWRMQTAWRDEEIFQDHAKDLAAKIRAMSAGRLSLRILPADATMKTPDMLEGVAKGALDACHCVVSAWYGKHPALALWGSGPTFGMDANMLLAWHHLGGGKALLEEIYRSLNAPVLSFLHGPMPTQPLGWFRKAPTRPEDFKAMRYRVLGLPIDLFSLMGATVSALPAREVPAAFRHGLIDGAALNGTSFDRATGVAEVAKVCMLQSLHQPAESLELLVNRRSFEALPDDLRAIVQFATQAVSAEASWKTIDRSSRDYLELQDRQGVSFFRTPVAILRAQLRAWDEVSARKSTENSMFRKVMESMYAFAGRAARWQNDTQVDARIAYDHYFPARRP